MSGTGPRPRRVAEITAAAAAALVIGLCGLASGAGAASTQRIGGVGGPGAPSVSDVICLTNCVGLRKVVAGSTVEVSGHHLSGVTTMTFPGRRDRVDSEISNPTARTAVAVVPAGAMDGPVRVKDAFGNGSNLSPTKLEIHPREDLGSSGQLEIAEAVVRPQTSYFFGIQAPRLIYVIRSNQRLNDLRINVVNGRGKIVRSFFRDDVPVNTTQSVRWGGKKTGGGVAGGGRYSFRISSQSGASARVGSSNPPGALGFKLFGYIFPERGPHDYGTAINRFGAPRSGHTHQGQDILAHCGTKLVAARGGRVKYSGYEGAAGNYIVINGKATGIDTVYMHLRAPSPLKEGQVVRTGQKIGNVGETGDARGCHLHFEMWTKPGWYTGGHPIDPLSYLKRWDRHS